MSNANVSKTLKQIDKYFSKSDDENEKTMYRFFKKEIKSKDIKIAHTDMSIIGRNQKDKKICMRILEGTKLSQEQSLGYE